MRAAAIAALALLPGAAVADSMCDKYSRDMVELSGDARQIVAPLVRRYVGAGNAIPSKEIGCHIRLTPFIRGVILGFSRPEQGGAEGARETREIYANGAKSAPTPEPSLGTDGFSLLTSVHSSTPNYLIVVGHGDALAVQVIVHKGYQSKDEISAADFERARALVRRALNEPF